jgi:hypothetical protein
MIENPYRLARDIRGVGFRTAQPSDTGSFAVWWQRISPSAAAFHLW